MVRHVGLVFLACVVGCSSSSGGANAGDGGTLGEAGNPGDGGSTSGWPAQIVAALGSYANAASIATDAMGNVYVTGGTGDDGGDLGCFLAKVDPTGHVLWIKPYAQRGCTGVAVDSPRSAVYLATSVNPANTRGNFNASVLLKLDLDGNLKATQTLTPAMVGTQTLGAIGHSVAVDAGGDVFIGGLADSPIMGVMPGMVGSGEEDDFVAKYDATGAVKWVAMLGTNTGMSIGNWPALATDTAGDLLLTTEASASVGGQAFAGGLGDIVVAKFDGAMGTTLWVRDDGTSAEDSSAAIAVDAAGNAYITGFSAGALDGNANGSGMNTGVVLAYDASGTRKWTREDAMPGLGVGLGLDPKGLPIAVAATTSIQAEKYDATGTKVWTTTYGTTLPVGAATDASGNCFSVGASTSPDTILVVRFLPDGKAG
jgi:hypothetical protein